jgi:hypothetical protein
MCRDGKVDESEPEAENSKEKPMKKLMFLLLALVPATALAAERPDWAFPPAQNDPNAPADHDDGLPKQVPGSAKAFTQAQNR